ncbi:MAG: cell division protein ZapD [Pseudomonadota bacterium]
MHFEHPLNERIRKFLRLEFILAQARHHVHGRTAWEARATLSHLLEILDALGRSDIKSELIAELDRQRQHLERLRQREGVDQAQLGEIIHQLQQLLDRLHGFPGQPGQALRHHELFTAYRQRASMPGGTAPFDLPALHFWLQQPHEKRQIQMESWIDQFGLLAECIETHNRLVRETARRTQEIAHQGCFEQVQDPERPYQLLRISLAGDSGVFPEISAGRHRLTIRFLHQPDLAERATLFRDNVPFRLACCGVLP